MSRVRFRPRALADIEDIGDYIALENPARAVTFLDELLALCARVAEQPRAFQRRDDLAHGLRQAIHGRYLLLFRCDDQGIVVVRVLHGARRLNDLL